MGILVHFGVPIASSYSVEVPHNLLLTEKNEWSRSPLNTNVFLRIHILQYIVATNQLPPSPSSLSNTPINMSKKLSYSLKHFWIFQRQSTQTSMGDWHLRIIWLESSRPTHKIGQSGSCPIFRLKIFSLVSSRLLHTFHKYWKSY